LSEISVIQSGPVQVNSLIVPLTEKYVFIIDPAGSSLTGDENSITGYLCLHDLIPVAVVLTHGHFDHVIGLPVIHETYPDIRIAIHENDMDYLGANSAVYQERSLVPLGCESLLPAVSNLPGADCLFRDGLVLSNIFDKQYCLGICNNREDETEAVFRSLANWKILHTPGHTPGSVCLYNAAAGKLISGDTLFYQSYGRTDLYGGSEKDMMNSLAELRHVIPAETSVYPGHGFCGFPFSSFI